MIRWLAKVLGFRRDPHDYVQKWNLRVREARIRTELERLNRIREMRRGT